MSDPVLEKRRSHVRPGSIVHREEARPVFRFLPGQNLVKATDGNRAVLKAALGKDRHVEAGDGLDAARNNFALERIKFFHGHVGERRERDALAYFYYRRTWEGTETREAVMPGGRVGPEIAAAQPAAVGERVFGAAHAPAFLVEHQVVYHATDGQFRIFLNRIILQILVAAV